jgi:hypothetical protein
LIQSVIYWVVLMRLVPVLALMTSAFALAACAGGDGATLSAAGIAAGKPGICIGLPKDCIAKPTGGGTTSTTDPDGDGIPVDQNGTDGDGTTGSGAGGNTTGHTAGNRTIALQKFVLDKPAAGTTAISQVNSTLYPTFQGAEDAIMSTNKPKTLKFTVDTKTANNAYWAVPVEMAEDIYGTRDLRWITVGHVKPTFFNPATYNVRDHDGNLIAYDPATNTFRYTATTTFGDETFYDKDEVDFEHDDFYWNQIKAYMGSKANAGSKDKYREYRVKDTAANRDEVLQVWNWNDSYSLQYQNQIISGDAKQQAWSFGGKEATNMPTSGKSKYQGRFAATAKIEGWKAGKDSDINPNTVWKVQGSSEITADFGASTDNVTGTLTPETWNSFQTKPDAFYTWYTKEAAVATTDNSTRPASIGTPVTPEYKFYSTKIKLKGTVGAGDTTTTTTAGGVTTTTPVKNIYSGSAELDKFTPGDNTMLGGFFGTDAHETTGVFSTKGTRTEQIGGTDGQIDTFTGTESINGTFNGQCTPGVTCAP